MNHFREKKLPKYFTKHSRANLCIVIVNWLILSINYLIFNELSHYLYFISFSFLLLQFNISNYHKEKKDLIDLRKLTSF